jgi:hypothetical protein
MASKYRLSYLFFVLEYNSLIHMFEFWRQIYLTKNSTYLDFNKVLDKLYLVLRKANKRME